MNSQKTISQKMTLQKTLLAILFAGPLMFAQTALAQQGANWQNDTRWFVTAQVGEADYDTTLERGSPWWGDVDDSSTAYGLGIGYNVLPQLGVRLTYEWARDVRVANRCPPGAVCPAVVFTESADTEALSLVAIPRWSFAPGWDLFGTAGIIGWEIDPDGDIGRDRGTDVLAGVGIGYEFRNGAAVAVEYQETVLDPDLDYEALRLSLSYNFGS